MHSKENEKVSKDIETEFESDLDLELKFFTCVIRNFNLDDNKSNCFISFLSSRNSVEDSKIEGGYT